MAASIVDILIRAKNQASKEIKETEKDLGRLDKAAIRAGAALGVLASAAALQQFARFSAEMSQLNTQIERSTYAFEHFSGGAAQAGANLRAVQRASGGAIDSLSAQNIAVTAMTQGLASNSVELERITRIARGIVSVSPIINDLESAFSRLGLTIANQSMMHLDQLGTSAAEIKPKIEALKKANKDLTDEQAFQAALLGTLETKFNSLTGAAVNQASGLERLSVAWKEYRNSASSAFAWVDTMAGGIADALDQQTKFDFGKWLAGQMGNPEVMGELSYAQKQIVSKLKELTDLSMLDKLKMGDQFSIQVTDLVDQYFKLGDAFARTSQKFDAMMNVIDPSSIQGPQSAPDNYWTSYTEGMSSAIAENAKAAKKAIAEITEAQARAAQNKALTQTGDYDFAQSEYERAKQAARELIATNAELGRSVTDLVPVFSTLLGDAIDTDYTDNIAELRKQVFGLIETLARAEQSDFVLGGGDALQSIEVYNAALAKLRSLVGSGDFNLGSLEDLKTLLNVLPGMLQNAGIAAENAAGGFDTLATAMRGVVSIMGRIDGAMQGTASTVAGFLAKLADMTGDMQMELFSIGADFGQGLEGGRDFTAQMLPEVQQMVVEWGLAGATLEEITQVLLPNYLSDLESANAELYATSKSVKTIDAEFESLKNTVAGIVSGAIGPVAGVDANDLLPRPDAVNENARRLADIAVNGFKGQDWLDEFKNEVPDIYQALVESGDPKTAAAQMLKDFQDGLINGTGVLIDKERAKDLVRRALLGQANTQSLINEIAQELAAETGTAFSTVQAQAQSILGGGGGLSSDGGTGAAFSRGMVEGVSNSTLGADLGGVVMAQITASVALIEDSGREAGRALVRGVTATFSDIPAAFIAQVAALVTPEVTAALANNGGRTSAAAS